MTTQLPLQFRMDDAVGFEGFYAGPNAEAVKRVQICATGGGELQLYLWGVHGCGKTHLLQAACRESDGHGQTAVYLPLQEVGEFGPGRVEGLENVGRLVCLDSLEAVAGDPVWEMALFDLFNRLRDAGTQLIVTASRAPADLGIKLRDLSSRLSWGLVYHLRPLNDDQKLAALQQRAATLGFELPADTGLYLLRHLPRNTASLFNLLDHLDRASLAAQRRLTIPFVKSILENGTIDLRKESK